MVCCSVSLFEASNDRVTLGKLYGFFGKTLAALEEVWRFLHIVRHPEYLSNVRICHTFGYYVHDDTEIGADVSFCTYGSTGYIKDGGGWTRRCMGPFANSWQIKTNIRSSDRKAEPQRKLNMSDCASAHRSLFVIIILEIEKHQN